MIINEGGLGGDKLAFCKTSAAAACDVAGVWIMPAMWVSELLGAKRVEPNQEMSAFIFFPEKWRLLQLQTANW